MKARQQRANVAPTYLLIHNHPSTIVLEAKLRDFSLFNTVAATGSGNTKKHLGMSSGNARAVQGRHTSQDKCKCR